MTGRSRSRSGSRAASRARASPRGTGSNPHRAVTMSLVDGPFDHLEGRWDFTPIGGRGTRADLHVALLDPRRDRRAGARPRVRGHLQSSRRRICAPRAAGLRWALSASRSRSPARRRTGRRSWRSRCRRAARRARRSTRSGIFARASRARCGGLRRRDLRARSGRATTCWQAGDRVEVLRPLAEDPRDRRRRLARAGPLDERRAQPAVDDTGRGSGIGSSTRVTLSPSNHTTRCRRGDFARMPAPQAVHVVPAVRVEAVDHHRRAEQEPHLAARHADLDLVHLLDVEQVALLDVHPIDASRSEERSEDQRRRGRLAAERVASAGVLEDNGGAS